MDTARINRARARTDEKLSYARVHLVELLNYPGRRGDGYEHAHQESFLFHFLGARDAFLAELNLYYKAGLASDGVSMGKIRNALKRRGVQCSELKELYELEQDSNSWLAHAKEFRDHSMHVHGVSRTYHRGGVTDGQVWLRHPKTNEAIPRDYLLEFSGWFDNMAKLLTKLRLSASSRGSNYVIDRTC